MKKTIYLFSIAFLICFQGLAQTMPIPDPNTTNVLFLKYSTVFNGDKSYYDSHVRVSQTEVIKRPAYMYVQKLTGDRIAVAERFYVPNPEEFAYIDPAVYNSVSLDLNQLYNLLKPKDLNSRQPFLKTFHEIYLIDYEQKYNRGGTNKVKILRVKPCDFWD
jgi:hypothetical protein